MKWARWGRLWEGVLISISLNMQVHDIASILKKKEMGGENELMTNQLPLRVYYKRKMRNRNNLIFRYMRVKDSSLNGCG